MLHVCPSCARHVRASETACPFCAARLGFATRTSVASRLGRSALLALAACGGPSCPPRENAESPVEVVTLADGGTEIRQVPIAIYGTVPPCH
jgi:hypothetical protein